MQSKKAPNLLLVSGYWSLGDCPYLFRIEWYNFVRYHMAQVVDLPHEQIEFLWVQFQVSLSQSFKHLFQLLQMMLKRLVQHIDVIQKKQEGFP